jgi:uncharacterized protein YbjT (DUF2867 family)
MKIVVIGGTGLIGSKLVYKLAESGNTVISASPSLGINTLTVEGLYEAVKDADVVVDVSNYPISEGNAVLDFFKRSTINLVTAEAYAGVKHHIALSIVGADRLPDSSYFRAKIAQEELIRESGMPYSILRSTQFFELAERIAKEGTICDEVHISPAAIQPIAADEVVSALTDLIFGKPLNATIEIAGPVLMPMFEFIRYYMNSTEDWRQLVEDERALYFGTELNDKSLVPGENARLGKIKYEDWFSRQLVNQSY